MGVMPCRRNSCDNILCDTYVDGHGYICNDCIDEFKRKTGETPMTKKEIDDKFKVFMKSEKFEDESKIMTVNDFFEK